MFRFEDPQYLWLLALVVVLAAIHFFSRLQQRRRLRRFGDPDLVKELMPDVSRWRPSVKFWLLEGALALLIVCLARPQFGKRVSETVRGGIETVICFDVSNSMLAEDVKPSRLRRAKMMMESIVDHFTNDKIALVVFAGDAFVQMPITSDSVSVKMFLNNIDPSMIRNQGTDLGQAISLATHCFTDEQDVGKAIIIITDGEDHEEGALEAARQAHEMGRNIYVLGIGSTSGAPIRLPGTNDFMQDNRGEKVMTALNEDMCRQVAEAGEGVYIHVDNSSNAQRQLEEALGGLQQKESTVYSDYDEQFQAFGVLALLLLVVEACLLERKNRIFKNFKLFKRPVAATSPALVVLLAVCLFPFGTASAQSLDHQGARLQLKKGNKAFRSDRRNEATTFYQKAVKADSTNARALYNLATSMIPVEWQNVTHAQEWGRMEPGRRDSMVTDIVNTFKRAANAEENPNRRQLSFFNAGVLCQGAATGNQEQQQQQYLQQAIEHYKEALKYNPNDDEARYNLVLCMRQLKPGQGDGGGGGDNKDENDDKQKDEQQQQQQQDQKQDQQQQPQQQQPQMSEDNVEQLLKAAMQNEEQTQRRVEQNQRPPEQRRQLNEKNW